MNDLFQGVWLFVAPFIVFCVVLLTLDKIGGDDE